MLETISEYIDLRLIVVIFIAFVSFIILKYVYKKISMNKIIQILLTIIVILGNIYCIYTYIDTLESEYVDTKQEYYIKGEVKFISDAINKIRIEYSDTNMVIKDLDSNEILVNIKNSTAIYDRNGKKINLDEIQSGDFINVKTSTNTLSDGAREITASKIQKY